MGIENNECVIATTWDDDSVDFIRQWVNTLKSDHQALFAFLPSLIDNKATIVLSLDGSKKGWDIAVEGALLRDSFIEKLEELNGGSGFAFVEVGYGGRKLPVLRENKLDSFGTKKLNAINGGEQ